MSLQLARHSRSLAAMAVASGVLVWTSTAWGHPGHGPNGGDHGAWHYLTTAPHLAMAFAAAFAAVACWFAARHWLRPRPTQPARASLDREN